MAQDIAKVIDVVVSALAVVFVIALGVWVWDQLKIPKDEDEEP